MSPVDVDLACISAWTSFEVAMNTPCPGTNSFFLKRCYEIIEIMFIDLPPLLLRKPPALFAGQTGSPHTCSFSYLLIATIETKYTVYMHVIPYQINHPLFLQQTSLTALLLVFPSCRIFFCHVGQIWWKSEIIAGFFVIRLNSSSS